MAYDHKYVYSHFGYNLQATDLQAAVGCAQLNKLEKFTEARKHNWQYLRDGLEEISDYIILPELDEKVKPSWFGFLMMVKDDSGFKRNDLAEFLERKNIQTRYLFAGNFLKQPCFDTLRKENRGFRIVGTLENTDKIMNQSLWIGVYPGMTEKKLDYMIGMIKAFCEKLEKNNNER